MAEPVSEERQKAYFERARKGVLAWLAERDGAATTLAEMHEYSSAAFLIAHQGFSKMMESFVDEGLVDYDEGTGTATLTEAGRMFIASSPGRGMAIGGRQLFFAPPLLGQDLWYQVLPSLMWLPFLRMRSLHFGHVPITTLLAKVSDRLLYRAVATRSPEVLA